MRTPLRWSLFGRRDLPWLTVGGAVECSFTLTPLLNERGITTDYAVVCKTAPVVPDVNNGRFNSVQCARILPRGYTEQQLVLAAAATVREIYDHEWREQFRYRGARVFDPHAPGPGLVLPVRP